jgi:hypothetical protein
MAAPPPVRMAEAGPDMPAPAIADTGGVPLEADQLVAELPDIQVTGIDNLAAAASCYRYGPIPDEELIKGLQDWFRSRNASTSLRATEERGSHMFWVYLAPPPSRESALAMLEDMKNRGIGDFRLITRGNMANAISLGLFASREAVDARLRELREKGYVPVVVPYPNVRKVYWLDTRIPDASPAMQQMYEGHPSKFASVPVSCDEFPQTVPARQDLSP